MIPDRFGLSKIINGKEFNRTLLFPLTIENKGSKQLIINRIAMNLRKGKKSDIYIWQSELESLPPPEKRPNLITTFIVHKYNSSSKIISFVSEEQNIDLIEGTNNLEIDILYNKRKHYISNWEIEIPKSLIDKVNQKGAVYQLNTSEMIFIREI